MAQGDGYDAVGGTVTLPVSTIKVTGGAVEKQVLGLTNVTGPGDNGSVKWHGGNYRYGFSIRGVYAEGSSSGKTLDEDTGANVVIDLGNGERWTGPAIIQQLRASPDWGPGGSIGAVLSGVFNGTPTISHGGSG